MFIRTYNATLARNGWSSVNNHPLLNMMCVSPVGKEFLGAIDTSGHMKDVVYIAVVIKRYLIEVGPKNVVQVCMDNASVMRKLIEFGSRYGYEFGILLFTYTIKGYSRIFLKNK
jgi:hypothetical protein